MEVRRYPRSLAEFQRAFADEESCIRYLAGLRWPDGYLCPRCGCPDAYPIANRRLWQCRACRHQTSLTAGTVLHRTRQPLTVWFWAAYLVATLKPGISALQLGRQLGLRRYETAWMLLHKLRRAMVDANREPLKGAVEVDESWVGGKQEGLKGGRQTSDRKAVLVAVAVERRATSLGRVRMEIVPNASATILTDFVVRNVRPGSTIRSDAWSGYASLADRGYLHDPRSERALRAAGEDANVVPGVHRIVSNLKTWLAGTHHGVGADHLGFYLDEFVFRFNRRFYPMAGFATLLGLSVVREATSYEDLRGPVVDDGTTRRRGRATGLTRTMPRLDRPLHVVVG